jgi:hypothetical protein
VARLRQAFRADVRIRAGVGAGADFQGENFERCRLDRGNKSTVNRGSNDGRVAIFAAASTRPAAVAIFLAGAWRGTIVPPGARGIKDMRQLGSLLRSAPSRIGRRFAQIVAIAAASLPSVGA